MARTTSTSGKTCIVQIAGGSLNVCVVRNLELSLPQRQTSLTHHKLYKPGWNLWFDWHPPNTGDGNTVHYVFVPLWIPLLLVALPTVWLWRVDRRSKPTGREP